MCRNAMWRCENHSSCSFYIKLEERRKKMSRYDTTWPWGSVHLRGSTKSRKEWVGPTVRKDRVGIFVVWQDEMKMRCFLSTPGSPEYILHIVHSTSVTPGSLYTHRRFLTIYLEAVIELVWRCTWRPRLSELRDALGGHDWSSLEMHREAAIEWVWRCNWRSGLSELRDPLGGRDRLSLEMQLAAEVEWTPRCTLRPWSSKFGDAIADRDWVNSEIHSEAVIKWVWRCTCSRLQSSEIGGLLGGSRFGGWRDGSWDSIHWLTCNCENVESWVQHLSRDVGLAGSGRLSILGWCCNRC